MLFPESEISIFAISVIEILAFIVSKVIMPMTPAMIIGIRQSKSVLLMLFLAHFLCPFTNVALRDFYSPDIPTPP